MATRIIICSVRHFFNLLILKDHDFFVFAWGFMVEAFTNLRVLNCAYLG